ncbi:AAA family ATPase [Hyphobacterium sp. HN65]|uniref:AAA family ATPase n=1 Tax=Hyphobacterium lacteum TaxID=3116575 RepID=A0ABU7LNN9_9PROT|nr:AAA family ATPase [Hyphobacterium sp. HN65]MEE2524954.1 AAA family ATPase [Hyphobacterium sp. HN65]
MSEAELEPDCEAGCPPPREIEQLIGHDEAIASFDALHRAGRLHHAWMLTGPKGVGKASLAYLLAGHLLGEGAYSRIRAQSHPNLLVIRRPWDDKRKKWRGEITMDEIRRVPDFFSRKAGEIGWRIAIIDSLDELNINSANGLLKTLEEPPDKGILFLVTHSPGRLLPTIRSRCRRLDLRVPPTDETRTWLTATHSVSAADADIAIAMADGAPGRALALERSGALGLEKDIAGLIDRLPQWDEKASRRLAAKLSVKAGESLRPHFYASLIRRSAAQARSAVEEGRAPEPWLDAWRRLQGLSREADAIYLDPKQAALAALSEIEQAGRAAAR